MPRPVNRILISLSRLADDNELRKWHHVDTLSSMVVSLHKSVQLAWALANNEAQIAGDDQIMPIHLILGILKVGDASTISDIIDPSLREEDWPGLLEEGRRIRQYLEMSDDHLQRARKAIRLRVRNGQHPIGNIFLHRSNESLLAFQYAMELAVLANEEILSASHLLQALFERDFISTKMLACD